MLKCLCCKQRHECNAEIKEALANGFKVKHGGPFGLCSDCQKKPDRTFYLVFTNCDCASGRKLMSRHPALGMKCPYCGKVLGCMDYGPITTIRAKCIDEAQSIFNMYGRF